MGSRIICRIKGQARSFRPRAIVRLGGHRGNHHGMRGVAVSGHDQLRPQPVLSGRGFHPLRFEPIHPPRSVGCGGYPRAGCRRCYRDLHSFEFRAGSERSRCAGGHGRHLLQRWLHPSDCGRGKIDRLRRGDRYRGSGWPRRTDYSDRLGTGFHVRTNSQTGAGPAHRSCGCGRRCWHRRDFQYADWWRAVRDRIDATGSQRQHVPAGRHRDGRGNLSRPAVFWTGPRILCARDGTVAQQSRRWRFHAAALHRARRPHRRGRRSLHSWPASYRKMRSTRFLAVTSGT